MKLPQGDRLQLGITRLGGPSIKFCGKGRCRRRPKGGVANTAVIARGGAAALKERVCTERMILRKLIKVRNQDKRQSNNNFRHIISIPKHQGAVQRSVYWRPSFTFKVKIYVLVKVLLVARGCNPDFRFSNHAELCVD